MKNRNRWKNLAFVLALLLILEGTMVQGKRSTVKAAGDDLPATVLYASPAAVLYAAPDGTADGDGSEENPYDVQTAINQSSPGVEIHLAEGVYYFNRTITIKPHLSGKSDAKCALIADGEVIFDFSGHDEDTHNYGVRLSAWNWVIDGIHVRMAGSCGMYVSGSYNVVRNCVFESNENSGLQISTYEEGADTIDKWASYNLILNCTSYNNCDAHNGGEDADGFAAKVRCGVGNVFDGCISYNNSDDGWDLFAKPETGSIGKVTIRNCVAFRNGFLLNGEGTPDGDGNGFKLGGSNQPTPHEVINCLAFENMAVGFTDNNNPSELLLRNCTSVNNAIVLGKTGKNYNFGREQDGVKKSILSYINMEHEIDRDKFNGTLEHSVYLNYGKEMRYIDEEYVFAPETNFGTVVSMTDDDFYSVQTPDSNADIHALLRDEDGTINLHGLYEMKCDSAFASMAHDGGSIGARLSNEQQIGEEQNPDLRKEAYTMPRGDIDLGADLMEGIAYGTYVNPFSLNEFTFTATKEKTISVDYAGVNYPQEDLFFIKQVLMGGTGQRTHRSILYTAVGETKLSVYAKSSSSTLDREIKLCTESGSEVERLTLQAGAIRRLDFTVPSAGTYYITSVSSGWNVYWVTAESGGDVSGGDASGGDASGGDVTGGDVSGGDVPVHRGLEVFLVHPNERYVYSGKPIKPEIEVLLDGVKLIPNEDYVVKYSNNVKASTTKYQGCIAVQGRKRFAGTAKTSFWIEQADIQNATAGTLCVVSGSIAKPILSYGGVLLTTNDYVVVDAKKKYYWQEPDKSYVQPVLTVNGRGNFTGSIEIPITVIPSKAERRDFVVSMGKENLTYDGTEKKPASLAVHDKKDRTKLLEEGVDYQVIYPADIVNAGTVKFTVVGINGYAGSVSKSYVIKPYAYRAEQTNLQITASEQATYSSMGATLSDIQVKVDGVVLTEGADYRVTYSDNKRVHNASYRVTFYGNYKGVPAQKRYFAITPASLADAEILVSDMIYKKAGVYKSKPYISIQGAPVKTSDYIVSYYLDESMTEESLLSSRNPVRITQEMKDGGETQVTVYVKIKGKGTNLSGADEACGRASYQVIVPKTYDLSKAKVSFVRDDGVKSSRFEYSGRPIQPKVIVTIGKETVPESAYEVSYINNVNRGKATALIRATEGQERYSGTKTAGFTIVEKKLLKEWLENLFR